MNECLLQVNNMLDHILEKLVKIKTMIMLIIISSITLAYSSESFNIEIRPMVCQYIYKTSEPLIIMTYPEYYLTYKRTQQEIYLYGSEFSISGIKHIPINIGIGFFYGDKNPIYSDDHPGSVLDGINIRLYLFDAFCEYQRKIIGIIDGSISMKIAAPYIKYDNELTKNYTVNFCPKIDVIFAKWLSFNCSLDYRINDLKYKKIYVCYDAEGDQDAYKLYSTVMIDNLSYQLGLSFNF